MLPIQVRCDGLRRRPIPSAVAGSRHVEFAAHALIPAHQSTHNTKDVAVFRLDEFLFVASESVGHQADLVGHRAANVPGASAENDDAGRRGTQGRHLEVAGRLTGVHRQLEQRQRERIAVRLGVATLTLIAGARRWGRSLQSRGEAILEVLAAIPIGASLLDRLLAAGALSGLWNSSQPRSAPQRWDALRGSWVIAPGAESARSASEPVERRAAVAAQQRAPPHTSSLHPGAEPRSTVGA